MSCDQSIKLSCRIFRDSFHFSGDQVFVFYKRSLGSPKKKKKRSLGFWDADDIKVVLIYYETIGVIVSFKLQYICDLP